jgi:hypothetical protein
MLQNKCICILFVLLIGFQTTQARQHRHHEEVKAAAPETKDTTRPAQPPKEPIKKFNDLITAKAKAKYGLFNVYFQNDRYFVEIRDSIFNREMVVVNRISKGGANVRTRMAGFSGDQINENVVRFEKGPGNKIFLRSVSYNEWSKDSTQSMHRAVMNSNLQPIVAAFDTKAYSKDSAGVVIDLTDYMNGDNDILYFNPIAKGAFNLAALQADKSYIVSVNPYPTNLEVKAVKTYMRSGIGGGMATLELNSSIVLLPAKPMTPRYWDKRVGYFGNSYVDFDANPQGIKPVSMIARWRLEPKPADAEKYKRGELVEPQKPIVFYIDPATPKKWIPYLIAGVNDWQGAFEQAGFKNAIYARLAPTKEEDSTWSIEDARYSAIVYKPSVVANASGPHVSDPRTGEILESHINWYHNVMELLRNWYFIQCSPNDPRARTMQFSDSLMGDLIRFVSSHEVGHTIGLRHNFGASTAYPVEKLRDKEWVRKHGIAPSIMDYARFNYVAQPEDGLSGSDLYPRINYYDKWAVEWGYRVLPDAKTPEAETPVLHQWVIEKLKDRKYYFGAEQEADDPRDQSEDLGDDAMKASLYGIKNLQRIMPNMLKWTYQPNEDYQNLYIIQRELKTQFMRYVGHVATNIGGSYNTPRMQDEEGPQKEAVPRAVQKEAVRFLQQQLFTTPHWMLDTAILSRTYQDPVDLVRGMQSPVLSWLLSAQMLNELGNEDAASGGKGYPPLEFLNDLQKGIWSELYTRKSIDIYRRNLQKLYVRFVLSMIKAPVGEIAPFQVNPLDLDASSIGRAHLAMLKKDIWTAIPLARDTMTRIHLQELAARISLALDPK